MNKSSPVPIIFAGAVAVGVAALTAYGTGKTAYLEMRGSDLGKEFLEKSGYTKIIELNDPNDLFLRTCPKTYKAKAYNARKADAPPSNVTVCVGSKPYVLEK